MSFISQRLVRVLVLSLLPIVAAAQTAPPPAPSAAKPEPIQAAAKPSSTRFGGIRWLNAAPAAHRW